MATEKRLIYANSAQMVVEYMEKHLVVGDSDFLQGYIAGIKGLADGLAELPSVDAVEVVHGRWIYDSSSGKYFCSACDEYALSFKKDTIYGGDLYEVCLTDYCPNCGAKMDGDGDA